MFTNLKIAPRRDEISEEFPHCIFREVPMRKHDAFPQVQAKSRTAFNGFKKRGKERKVSPRMFSNNDNIVAISADKAGVAQLGLNEINNATSNS